MGAAANPLHPDGLAVFFEGLKKAGISDSQIRMMTVRNPALLLGLSQPR
jgi:predicted metal-dependent phosphotriesterase family hydrolase